MKKYLFLSMALFAGLAFSPQPAFSAPDTGPKVDIEVVDNNSASADQIMPEQGIFLVSTTINNYSAFQEEVYGQETVVHRSDHTVGNTGFALCDHTKIFNMCTNLDLDKLVNVSSGRTVALEPERSCNYMIMNGDNQNFDHANVSTVAALHSHPMVWVMVRPGWTPTLLC